MDDIVIVAISVIASLTADAALDYMVFRNHKIGTKEYREALRFPKTARQKQEEIDIKLSEIEKSLNGISSVSYSDIEGIRSDVAELKSRLVTPGRASVPSEKEQQIYDILKDLAARVSAIEANQKSAVSNAEVLEYIKRVEANTKRDLQSLNDKIGKSDGSAYTPPQKPPAKPKSVPQTGTNAYTQVSSKVIEPSVNYVQSLINGVSQLESGTSSISYEIRKLKAGLLDVKKNGDFDDPEEIMNQIHELIKKYVYESDSKVSADEWKVLEQFLTLAGYEPIPVKAGDSIIPYKTYFDRPIPTTGGPVNAIKQIQLMPFVLSYSDSGETEVLKLCGKCTYYKQDI